MESNNEVYTTTLTLSSGLGRDGGTSIEYNWSPPLREALERVGGDSMKLPAAYQMMCYILERAVFPAIQMNEQYEAALIEDPSIADVLDDIEIEGLVH